LMPRRIDPVDHRRERCRFAGTCWSCNQHKSARLAAKIGNHVRQPELLERADLVGDHPENASDRLFLLENIDAETRKALKPDRVVKLKLLCKLVGLLRR